MEKLHIDCAGGNYDILTAPENLETALALPGRKLLVCDSNVAQLHREWAERLLDPAATVVFPAGEASKNADTLLAICRRAAELKLDRGATFVALGGGVTGDLTGFAAAIYLRGVKVMQIPTTLLAMVDSSVGGKTAIDLPEGKNLVGAFHQPCRVVIEPRLLGTLPKRELANGLAEVVKTAVLGDAALFELLEENAERLYSTPLPEKLYADIILRCCRVKSAIVAADAHEHGCRAFLNYGHTFGHALELLSGFRLAHGEGVAIGMVLAAKLAVRLGICGEELAARQLALLRALELPTRVPAGIDPGACFEAMRGDKKARDGKVVLILPEALGKVRQVSDVPPERIAALLCEVCA
ncbi:MAG: 3-dehydroquinate synthase [Lentisphaeria bacterium]|nr:3-dehydroquinate synthase [Lentisphaeria bacterium]